MSIEGNRVTVDDYPNEAIHELAGVLTLAKYRINKMIAEKGYDYTKTWVLIDKEYDQLTKHP